PDQVVGGGTSRPPGLVPLDADHGAELEAALDRARRAYGLDVLVVGLSIDAERGWSGGSGTAPDGRTQLDGGDPFAIASVTKTFTAAIVLQLVEERQIGLDDLVTDYLPMGGALEGVTVRQLLAHRSGILDIVPLLRTQLNSNTSRHWTPEEVLRSVGPSIFEPGSAWRYSNTNFVVLGMLVEAVTGQAFEDELARRLLEPMALDGAGMLLTPDAPWLFSESWASAFWTAGGMYATAEDLVRWGDALYGGWVLRPSSLRTMLAFEDVPYGLGAEELQMAGLVGYGHSGLLRGFTSLLVHLPDEGLTIAVLGTDRAFAPTALLTRSEPGQPSILDLALAAR
ncbi:MAG: serine hydrolase domain-containing protein, partial [Gammaproteobacteria bacterium]